MAQVFTTEYPSRVDGMILLSSKAKTILSPEVKWKLDNLLPILEFFGKLRMSIKRFLYYFVYNVRIIFLLSDILSYF